MNKQLDTCFDRVEKALGTLIDSIAKYNPSTVQVQQLGDANAELTRAFQVLQTHQLNHQKLEALRASTAKYDAQIRDTLRLLANTRKELINASPTVLPNGPTYEIQYDELLAYAGRISKTTIPPVGAVNAIETASLAAAGADSPSQIKMGDTAPGTAATTPAGGTPTTTPNTPQPLPQSQSRPQQSQASTNGTSSLAPSQPPQSQSQSQSQAHTELPEPLATFLNPHSAYTFVPWPSEEQIRSGSTAALAYLVEQGIEVENYDPEAERLRREREEEERKEAEERERVEREERDRAAREEQARLRAEMEKERLRKAEEDAQAWRRASIAVSGAGSGGAGGAAAAPSLSPTSPTQPKAQFQFMGDDDDDDDD